MKLSLYCKARKRGMFLDCASGECNSYLIPQMLLGINLCHFKINLYVVFFFFRTIWVRQRSGAWWEQVYTNWTDYEWQLNLKMRKTTFQQLCELLRPHLQGQLTTFRNLVPVEQLVALCIWRLATNVGFQTISHLFGIGQSTVVTIVNNVGSTIVSKELPLFIKTHAEDEFKLIIKGFRVKLGFPQCGGAIGGTHIGILVPTDSPADYCNSKGFYSVILQGVVDHCLRFWDISVGWPGKVSDATVLGNSSLYERGQSGSLFPHITERFEGESAPVAIVGDAAYPLLPWLITPYPENQLTNPAQLSFNNHLSKAQMTVKRAFGRLKQRWQCLMKRCDCNINNINTVISACCVLHNFCEENASARGQ